ncbi:MAG: chemotaxis protein CheW [Clostridiales bacterium]
MNDSFKYINSFKGLVVFILGEKEFCLNVSSVSAIIKPDEIEDYYDLYIHRSKMLEQFNRTIPLVDCKNIFGTDPKALTPESRIILIDCDFIIIGLCVEKVKEIISLEFKDGLNDLKYISSENNIYISGIIMFENREMFFPNVEKLCITACID